MKPRKPAQNPILYEINTWVWLHDLSQRYGRKIELGCVPEQAWQSLAALGVDFVWLMGVWQRSPKAVEITRDNPIAIAQFKQVLPDYRDEDLIGSAYSVRDYTVDARIGGPQGLAVERERLAALGIGLILDYVPNHVAPDHLWTASQPQYFVHGTPRDLKRDPESYLQVGAQLFARGRDPNFPAWQDVLQLNAFEPTFRQQTARTLTDILDQCDGVRVDMAMLMINRIFKSTWRAKVGRQPRTEFWSPIIAQVKAAHPNALFIAEAYWDTENELLQSGFDFCYDKSFYDAVRDHSARQLCHAIRHALPDQQKRVRFIENHDEQRAAEAFPGAYGHVAAILTATLPGMRFFHEGQLEGRRKRISVLLGRRPQETPDPDAQAFYATLFELLALPMIKHGRWSIVPVISERGGVLARCLAWIWQDETTAVLTFANISGQPHDVHVDLSQLSATCFEKIYESAPWADHTPRELRKDAEGVLSLTLPPEDAVIYQGSLGT